VPNRSYQIPQPELRKIWQMGVISLSELSFIQPIKREIEKSLKNLPRLGVDLERRYKEVKKLFMAHCAKMCLENRCDPEEVLQEVYKGILIRNKGECPYDPSKSAFSTYVVMVSKCVTINYVNKYGFRHLKEHHGVEDSIENEDHFLYISDVRENFVEEHNIYEIRQNLNGEAKIIFEDLLDGVKVSQISKTRNIDSRKVTKHIAEIRKLIEIGQ